MEDEPEPPFTSSTTFFSDGRRHDHCHPQERSLAVGRVWEYSPAGANLDLSVIVRLSPFLYFSTSLTCTPTTVDQNLGPLSSTWNADLFASHYILFSLFLPHSSGSFDVLRAICEPSYLYIPATLCRHLSLIIAAPEYPDINHTLGTSLYAALTSPAPSFPVLVNRCESILFDVRTPKISTRLPVDLQDRYAHQHLEALISPTRN